jgi:hypothetical protein
MHAAGCSGGSVVCLWCLLRRPCFDECTACQMTRCLTRCIIFVACWVFELNVCVVTAPVLAALLLLSYGRGSLVGDCCVICLNMQNDGLVEGILAAGQ